MANKWVYTFKEGNMTMRNLLGGKGANLAEMTEIGLPVPQGFTITTEACTQYYEDGRKINDEIMAQAMEGVAWMEKENGKKFGDLKNPLLVSVRSGARASMPGMMDTILNLGLNDDVVAAMIAGNPDPKFERFVYDSYRRFIQMFSDVVMEVGKKYFEQLIDKMKADRGVKFDVDLTAADLKAVGAMAALLKDAIKPNLIQTLEHTPALVHGGPFANIAHGCNSVRATKTALKMADYVITEAGFGADLGAEKFFDIKCRKSGLKPDAVVLVATVRALKYNGGVPKTELSAENLDALKKGIVNLEKHIENLQKYGVPVVVTLNAFVSDTQAELDYIQKFCEDKGCEFALAKVWEKGGEGGIELAEKVLKTLETKKSNFHCLYETDQPVKAKIETIAKEIYGAGSVNYSAAANKQIAQLEQLGFGNLPICMAKTQYSLSDDPTLLGRPEGFEMYVREAYVSAGAGFIVVLTGSVMTMPGLSKSPAAYNIDVNDDGVITGLF